MSIVKSAVDTYLAYRFVKLLVTDWEDTEAFKLGVIDDKGYVLKGKRERKTADEKRSYNTFHRLVYNLKKVVEKVPFMRNKLGRLSTALFLLKEHCYPSLTDKLLLEKTFTKYIKDNKILTEEDFIEFGKLLLEDAPTNSVSSGQVSGLTGDPPISKKKQKKNRKKVVRRYNWKKFTSELKKKKKKGKK